MTKLRINRPWIDKSRINKQWMARQTLTKLLFTFNVLLVALIMSGCITSALSGNPKPLMNSGIMKFEKKLKVPLFDGAEYLEISPDNRYLFVSGDKSKYHNLYDLETGKIIKRFLSHKHVKEGEREISKNKVAFSADSKRIYMYNLGNKDWLERSFFYVFDIPSLSFVDKIEFERGFISDVSRDGRYLIFQGPGSYQGQDHYNKKPLLALYDAKTHELISAVRKGFDSEKAIFTPDAKYVIDVGSLGDRLEDATEPAIRIWSVPDLELVGVIENAFRYSGKPRLTVDGRPTDHSGTTDVLSVTSDGKYLHIFALEYFIENGEKVLPNVIIIFDLEKKQVLTKVKTLDIVSEIETEEGEGEDLENEPREKVEAWGISGLSKHDKYFFLRWFSGVGQYDFLVVDIKTLKVVERVNLPKSIISAKEKVSPDGTMAVISRKHSIYVYSIED